MKKIITLFMAIVLVLCATVPTFATAESISESSTVKFVVGESWTVEIPEYIVPSVDSKDATQYSVTVKNLVLMNGAIFTTSVEYSGIMTNETGTELEYAFYVENEEVASGDIILEVASDSTKSTAKTDFIAVCDEPTYAGVYTDTAVFNCSIEIDYLAGAKYTTEDIEADDHLVAIGKTYPEWVVAEFNDDYTSVTILKNGDYSDGQMMDFLAVRDSFYGEDIDIIAIPPVYEHYDTCTQLIIEDGVTSIGDGAFIDWTILVGPVDFPESLISIGDMAFAHCYSLMGGLVFPENLEYIGTAAFFEDNYLFANVIDTTISFKTIYIPKTVSSIGENPFAAVFSNGIIVNSENEAYMSENDVLLTKDGKRAIYASQWVGVSELSSDWYENDEEFRNAIIATKSDILNGVEKIDCYAFAYAKFDGYLNIPNSVVNMGLGAFCYAWNISNITISGNIKKIPYDAFADVPAEVIVIQDGIEKIEQNAFRNVDSLRSLYIPSSVSEIEPPFYDSTNYLKGKLTVYGVSGSCAEQWAKANGYTFVSQ